MATFKKYYLLAICFLSSATLFTLVLLSGCSNAEQAAQQPTSSTYTSEQSGGQIINVNSPTLEQHPSNKPNTGATNAAKVISPLTP